LTGDQFEQLKQAKFSEFLTQLKEQATIVTSDSWLDLVPETPELPQAIIDYIQSVLQNNIAAPTPEIQLTPAP